MKKLVALLIALFLFASLACQTTNPPQPPTAATLTDPQAVSTRVALIDNQQETFFTPDTWSSAPQSCANSMTMVINKDGMASTGTLLVEEKWTDSLGNIIWIYYLLVSNHTTAEYITSQYVLLPGRTEKTYTEHKTGYINYSPIMSDSGQIGIDAGLLTVFSMSKISNDWVVPLGTENLKSGISLPESDAYYAFGYPGATVSAQFSISVVNKQNTIEPHTISFSPANTTTNSGSSGGAVCNTQGMAVAIVTGHSGNKSTEFTADPLPQNIAAQISAAINISHKILDVNKIKKAP